MSPPYRSHVNSEGADDLYLNEYEALCNGKERGESHRYFVLVHSISHQILCETLPLFLCYPNNECQNQPNLSVCKPQENHRVKVSVAVCPVSATPNLLLRHCKSFLEL